MKNIKKTMAIILAIIMIFSSLPMVGITVFATETDEPIFIAGELIDPIVPEGYYFTGKMNTDENGVTIYQIDTVDAQVVLPVDLWIYADGRAAQNPDVLPAYPDTDSDGEPDVMGTEDLPAAYDSRSYGYITPVEYQIGGSCWAHTAVACVEANYIKQGFGDTIDLSEYHTVWYSKNGYFKNNTDSLNDGYEIKNEDAVLGTGGNATDVSNAMLNFAGGALESSFPLEASNESAMLSEMKEVFKYDGKYISDVVLDAVKSIDYYYWKNVTGTLNFVADKDNPRIEYVKQAVMDYGAVFLSYNSDDSYYANAYDSSKPTAYYNPNNISTNHAVTIVGWDDNFSKENFGSVKPSKDGAWLIKNSWGTSWGDEGYFWLSYEDKTIYELVTVFEVGDKADYEKVYMYDGLGYNIAPYISGGTLSAANVFEADGDIYLTKISYGSTTSSDYTLKIYTGLPEVCTDPTAGTLAYTQSGTTDGSRYINIEGDVNISKGTKFSVVLEMSKLYYEGSDVEQSEEFYRYNANPGESFYKAPGGDWIDTTQGVDFGGTPYIFNNSCIRAVGKYVVSEGNFKVIFKDGIKYNEVVISDGSVVDLPERLGHTYVFTYNGQPFTGENITHDMTVETHCYLTVGEPSANSDCVIEYRCIYCGEEVKDAVAAHNPEITVVPATSKNIGYTVYDCKACGEYYYGDYNFYGDGVGGEEDGYLWQYADGCLSIIGEGKLPDFSSYDGHPWNSYKSSVTEVNVMGKITRLGSYFFAKLTKMKTITLPDTIEEIGEYCFFNTSALEKFECPENLLKIEKYGFRSSGITEFINNEILNTIGEEAFYLCTKLTEVTIPGTVKNIGNYPYRNCHKLKKIIVEEGVTYIANLIWETTPLEELVIPSTVTSLAMLNFNYCEKYTVAENNPAYCDVDGILFSKDMKTLVSYPPSKRGNYYKVPEQVTAFSQSAFSHTSYLKYLDMSDCKITTMNKLFNQTHSIVNVNLPESLTKINSSAFSYTTISKIYVPATVKTIGSSAFTNNGYSSYFVPDFYTDSENAAIKTWADSNGYECTVLHTEHSFDTVIAEMSKEPDCKNEGTALNTCVCGNFEYKTVPSTGEHIFVKGNKVYNTCTEDGYTPYTCSSCGFTENRDIVTAPGHDFTGWNQIVDPTCLDKGIENRVCNNCSEIETRDVPATGHSYQKVVTPATCTTDGYTTYTCHCGDTYTADEVTAKGHVYGEWAQTKAPTCTIDGEKERRCNVCGEPQTQAIPATGHSYNEVVTPATCTTDGYTTYTCHCSATYTANKVTAFGHNYGEWTQTKAPTCTATGENIRVCGTCGSTQTEAIPAKGHSYSKVVTAPTCNDEGYTTYSCACGYKYTDDKVSAKGHNYVPEITKAPTCTKEGVKTFTCANCGDAYTETIPANGHTRKYVDKKDATCTEPGYEAYEYCTVCDYTTYKVIAALGHTYGAWAQTQAPTCSVKGQESRICTACGNTETRDVATIDHSYTAAVTAPTCTAKGYTTYTCACGKNYKADEVAALGHTYGDWTQTQAPTCSVKGQESRTCTACGNTETRDVATIAHSYTATVTAPTCTTTGYTTYKCTCGYSYKADGVLALGHTYSNWTQTKAPTCSVKGQDSRTCAVCGNTETRDVATIAHSYSASVTAPTCTDKGYTTYTCACGYSYKANEVAVIDHYDNNGDELCDGCNKSLRPEDNCSCNCHKSGFMGLIWKIVLFFNKLFKSNKICSCGVAHY